MRYENLVPPAQEERADRSHLTDSRPMRWDLEAGTPNATAAIDALLLDLEAWEPARTRRRRGADRRRLRAVLEAVTLELWHYQLEQPTHWLAYARGGAGYAGPGRYRHPEATQDTVRMSADFLVASGLAEERVGSYRRVNHGFGTAGRGYRSRLRATELLADWAASQGLTAGDVSLNARFELVRLKGLPSSPQGPKPLVAYVDTPETIEKRNHLKAWISIMEGHRVTLLEDADNALDAAEDRSSSLDSGDAEERPLGASGGPCCLYRVFNEGRWDRGGRFYGGWWMGLPTRDRARLLIDGEETVELDFASLHPRLCYQLNGTPMDPSSDAYALPGMRPEVRDIAKVAFMQLLNTRPDHRTIRPPAGVAQRLRGRPSYRSLLRALQEKHAAISNWFCQGPRSLELQAVDAAIAEAVMVYFTTVARKPLLPVHDSFIVKRRDQLKLAETMALAYRGQLSCRGIEDPVMPTIRGWVDDDAEAKFNDFLSQWQTI